MPASMVLPGDVEQALIAALSGNLPDQVHVAPIADRDINDDDQLVLQMPCARTRYAGTAYKNQGDNQWLTYEVTHMFEIWCAAEDLTSKEAQRTATLAVVADVLPLVAGARLALADTSLTEPVAVKSIGKMPDDIVGQIYIVAIEICAIAQFPGTLAAGNEDE
jgi:phage gp37-like protein